MAADNSATPAQWPARQIETDDPDLLRSMVVSAEAGSLRGAAYGEHSNEQTNPRNGHRGVRRSVQVDEAGTVSYGVSVRLPDAWPRTCAHAPFHRG
ncbi:hypothetical protein [Nonomuraea jabiensis]|uniref:hypothetical protein n=1 Tax=Nonomuraea jabiensis TaxID=882448 RepID=UPI00367D2C85